MANWNCPLSPDSFSKIGILDRNVHKSEVKEAFRQLLLKVVPLLSFRLDKISSQRNILPSELSTIFHETGVVCGNQKISYYSL